MIDKQPFTIEIIGLDHHRPVIVDRVIGGSVHLEEAKLIGQHLLALTDAEMRPHGYRVLTNDCRLVYVWSTDDSAEQRSGSS